MEHAPGTSAPPAQESGTTSAKTSFLDLPPEIRVAIYNLVIPRDRFFDIVLGPPSLGPRGCDRLQLRPLWGRRPLNLLPGIIFVNKLTYSEATQILYARNEFVFGDAQLLQLFLQRIGPQVQHLRKLCHSGDGVSKNEVLQEIVTTLKSAKHLSSFGLTRELADEVGWCRSYSAKQLVKLLHPLLGTLRETRRNGFDEEKRDISKVISILPNIYYRGHRYKLKSDIEKDAEGFEAELRALIEERYA